MKIHNIISQHRRDFKALFVCEHCNWTCVRPGYDDAHFHSQVIPNWECENCGKKASDDYRPLATKYPEGMQL